MQAIAQRCGCPAPARPMSARRAAQLRVQATPESTTTTAPPPEQMQATIDALDALLAAPTRPATSGGAAAAGPATPSASSRPQPAAPTPSPLSSSTPPAAAAAAPAAAARRGKPASFEQVMGFEGFAPEVINGRAAMLGFVAAVSGELKHGESVFAQLVSGGAGAALLVVLAVTAASFAPAVRQVPWDSVFGKDKAPRSLGPFTPDAELRNGRAAMLGLAALLFVEGASSMPFFL